MALRETRSDYLLDMVNDAKGYGSGPMGTHQTIFMKSVAGGSTPFLCNLPVTIGASIILWGTAIFCILYDKASTDLGAAQSEVTNFFTWAYIGSNGIWFFLVIGIYMYFGNVRLGKDGERPQFDDANYFMMIFCAGVGIGLIYFGVSEPLWHYEKTAWSNRYANSGHSNDNEIATDAINLTLYHWGVHGWVVYTITAICLGVLSYRYDLPLTYRTCFFPLLGRSTWGWMGDCIDMITIAGVVGGVCTSLGLGAGQIQTGFSRMGWFQRACTNYAVQFEAEKLAGIPEGDWDGDNCLNENEIVIRRVMIIAVITLAATGSVLSGLDKGILLLSQVAFGAGMFLWSCAFALDNTWYLLNVMVQSFGYYIQWIIQIGWFTDAWGQLKYGGGRNINFDSDTGTSSSNGAHPSWMDWWTIFYWGWWISWSPFVGVFLARISRGRTVRDVINFTFSVPLLYCILWFAVFGGAGIKMQREAELLQIAGKEMYADGDRYYDGSRENITGNKCFKVPESLPCPEDMVLAGTCPAYSNYVKVDGTVVTGYVPDMSLSPVCLFGSADDSWFDLMDHYHKLGWLLSAFSLFTIILYFVTSSDSGSMVVDLIASNGEEAHPISKVYWAFTEGGLAMALLMAGGKDALKALQAVSIIAGVPFTIFVCLICLSIDVTFRYDQGWTKKHEYNTWQHMLTGGIFDWLEFVFSCGGAPKPDPMHILEFFLCLFCPPYFINATRMELKKKEAKTGAGIVCTIGSIVSWAGFVLILVFHIIFPDVGLGALAFFCYGCFSVCVCVVRTSTRNMYNIEGGMLQDCAACFFWYPQVVFQARKQVVLPFPEKIGAPSPEAIGSNNGDKGSKDETPIEESL